ncbi:MAG TPA: DUF1549 and DUF1553 domain-containing protein, partial [Gemmataceae bacterium]|nr:DUF1549 and DUF1553 domain-containing protein [Gemmataceae bacterium]
PAVAQFPTPDQYDARVKPKDREHWSFQPVNAPAVPSIGSPRSAVRNPIDAFVLATLREKGWSFAPPAEPRAILRRVHLNLTGLPPTLAEQEEFLKDPSPERLDRVVDDLLGRLTYGERYARRWLDLARYADSNGYERDAIKPSVWRYRDYVINAFNADKPFDRFVREQLAGDELADATEESVIATTFLRLGPWDDEPADPATDRYDQLDDLVSTTGQVFLGLTVGCARCHDHKFEPLSMLDYYRLVAVFAPLTRPQAGRTELDVYAVPAANRPALAARDRARLLGGGAVAAAGPDPVKAYLMTEAGPTAPVTTVLLRGSATRPGTPTPPGVPHVLAAAQPKFLEPDAATTRRRRSLADWIVDPKNPLTARVIVNRVWQWHFGDGLVRTESDFGKQGERPSHRELLDWLADWFVREGWSVKKLNRLILTSNVYRQSSRVADAKTQLERDPDNRLLWRFPYRRLEVEAIRDGVLAASGALNPAAGGPGVFLPIPKEALEGNSDPKTVWKPSPEADTHRRTIYAAVKRSLTNPLLETLDLCDTARSSAKRLTTTVAPQALTLFNGEFVNRQAGYFADRLEREAGPDRGKQIERAYRLALGRPPTDREVTLMTEFLARAGGDRRALEQVGRVVFNLNEFVYPD